MGCSIMFDWLNPEPEMSEFDKQLLASNIVGAKSLDELTEKERNITYIRSSELKENPIQGNLDYAHLKEIHRYLFKDVYDWAGKDRYEMDIKGNYRKGDTSFTPGYNLPEVAKKLFDDLKSKNHFKHLTKMDFVKSAAAFMNGLNILHPFREGNGRTQRIFMEQLAKNAGFVLDLSKVNKESMIQASMQGAKGNIKGFEIMIKNHIQSKQKNLFPLRNNEKGLKI